MRTLIVGAGGVGGNLAARLAAAPGGEQDIWLLARGEHAARIREHGIELRHLDGTTVGRPTVVERLSEARGADLTILAVKEPALEDVLSELESALAPGGWVLPLLNGLPRAAELRLKLPMARLFEACIYVASRRVAPGVIEQQSPFCRIVLQGAFEPAAAAEAAVCDLLTRGGIACTATRSIGEAMWTKFLFVCPMAGVTSLYGRTFGEVLTDPESRALLVASMREIAELAAACGTPLGADAVADALRTAESFPPSARTSMQNDFADGRPTELEAFSGAVLRLAERHGVAAPAHRAIYEGLRARSASA
ncbi:MAG TPA: ketopantoate reductase family protein [Gemmatimonadaceae bacterium]